MLVSNKLMFELANDLNASRPSIGKQVKVINSRNHHVGETGIVISHSPDPNHKYAEEWRWLLMRLTGIEGHLIRIDTGTEKIWLKAIDVQVIEEIESSNN